MRKMAAFGDIQTPLRGAEKANDSGKKKKGID
jgi:hypothetical protein